MFNNFKTTLRILSFLLIFVASYLCLSYSTTFAATGTCSGSATSTSTEYTCDPARYYAGGDPCVSSPLTQSYACGSLNPGNTCSAVTDCFACVFRNQTCNWNTTVNNCDIQIDLGGQTCPGQAPDGSLRLYSPDPCSCDFSGGGAPSNTPTSAPTNTPIPTPTVSGFTCTSPNSCNTSCNTGSTSATCPGGQSCCNPSSCTAAGDYCAASGSCNSGDVIDSGTCISGVCCKPGSGGGGGPTPPGGGGSCPATCPAGQTCPSAGCLGASCVASQVNVCGDNTQCIPACSSGPTATPIPSCPVGQTNPHSQCSGGACTSVSGCGPNKCPSNTYSTCDFGAQQCVVKSSGICGTTPSTCANNSQCYVPNVSCNPIIPPSTISWKLGVNNANYGYVIKNSSGVTVASGSVVNTNIKNFNCAAGTCVYTLTATLNGVTSPATTCHYYGPWFSGAGGDMRIDAGFVDLLPSNAIHAFLDGSGGTNGVAFSGNTNPQFGENSHPSQLQNWIGVGSSATPLTFHPSSSLLAYSYTALQGVLQKNGITPTVITAGDCDDLTCLHPASATTPPYVHGVYQYAGTVTINTPLHLTTGNTTPATAGQPANIILLIQGNLNINSTILVDPGVTLTIAVGKDNTGFGGNIIVNPSVGETTFKNQQTSPVCNPLTHNSCDLEGFYIADNTFTVNSASSCPGTQDKQLNIAGLVAVNGKFGSATNQFKNNRSLCDTGVPGGNDNSQYPTVTFTERPDMIVNAPDFFKKQNFIWQEVGP